MGYHIRHINKGTLGQVSKLQEELEELVDAEEQGIRIMAMCELADIYGALQAMADKYGLTMADLKSMADATARAFKDGSRR
jgi:phosphoribosyl-ATP pyrophosphohydrolase